MKEGERVRDTANICIRFIFYYFCTVILVSFSPPPHDHYDSNDSNFDGKGGGDDINNYNVNDNRNDYDDVNEDDNNVNDNRNDDYIDNDNDINANDNNNVIITNNNSR